MKNPTLKQFSTLSEVVEFFNKELFEGKLPPVVLNLSRATATICGHFSPNRWTDADEKVHEINLNPKWLAGASDLEIAQTLVHEMCHLWQHEFGKPSRSGYHNKEWADKMESIGLMPSSTGREGGRRTGQQMDDYPIEGGRFLSAFEKFSKEILPLKPVESISRRTGISVLTADLDTGEDTPTNPPKSPKNKIKYTCGCGFNVWGKPALNIICGECQEKFEEQG